MKKNIHSWNDILSLVQSDRSINFTAIAVTPWNALSIDALLLFLAAKGIKIKAIIVIAEHYSAGYMISPSCFTNNCADYYYLPFSHNQNHNIPLPEENKKLISRIHDFFEFYKLVFGFQSYKEDTLYYSTFNHSFPDAILLQRLKKVGRRIVICHTEEGVGAYMGTFDNTYPPLKKIKSFAGIHDYIRNIFFGKVVYRKLHKTYNSLTLIQNYRGLQINKEIIPYYRAIFRLRNKELSISIDKEEIRKSIIICTTAWRRNEIKENDDLRVLIDVCNYLWEQGEHLLLKTHPRDAFFIKKADILHCKVLNTSGLSMESLCEYACPKAIVSFSSTTLINPRIFWNIPTFCISDMLNRGNISNFYLDEIDSFKQTFKKFVVFINSSQELETTIISIKP